MMTSYANITKCKVSERSLVCYECPVSQCQEMSFITFPGTEQKVKKEP